jgi:hypothetical protein
MSLRDDLATLAVSLRECDEPLFASTVETIAAGSDEEVKLFLRSNDLWGGAGSIADQAGLESSRLARRRLESVLIDHGTEQLVIGVINVRTAGWVKAFNAWKAAGI